MKEQRSFTRIPVQGIARHSRTTKFDWYFWLITNLSGEGLGIGIPYHENIQINKEIKLTVTLPPLVTPIIISGTIMWAKIIEKDYDDFHIIGGIRCREIISLERWRLIYDTWRVAWDKKLNNSSTINVINAYKNSN
jgi:hypothetical protein